MSNQQRFVPVEVVLAGDCQCTDAKLEKLNRARLDALGYMLQASHWLKELVESARKLDRSLTDAERLLRKRERALEKADKAFWAYAERKTK